LDLYAQVIAYLASLGFGQAGSGGDGSSPGASVLAAGSPIG